MSRPTPISHLPLGALRGFEAAARLKSFTAAAQELHLTQSAVSHQIRTLEGALGQPLFHREHRRVILTDSGFEFWRVVRECLKRLDHGIMRARAYSKPASLIIAVEPVLASRWLVHRLPEFQAKHPEIDVWLYSTDKEIDVDTDEVDIVIGRAGEDTPPGPTVVLATGDVVTPHCTPGLARRLKRPGDLAGETLIHDERDEDWPTWCALAGLDSFDPTPGPSFSDPHHSLIAAEGGHGVVLASRFEAIQGPTGSLLETPFPDLSLPLADYVMTVIEEPVTQTMTDAFVAWVETGISSNARERS